MKILRGYLCGYLFIVLLTCVGFVSAQNKQNAQKSASKPIQESTQEYESFRQLLLKSPNLTKEQKEEIETVMLEYMPFYDGLNSNEQALVENISEKALKNKIRPYPDLLSFYQTHLLLSEKHPKNCEKWLAILDETLSNKRLSDFNKIVTATKNLVKENTFYKTNTGAWVVEELNFEITTTTHSTSTDKATSNTKSTSQTAAQKPIFKIQNTNILCKNSRDSVMIENTQGDYYPLENAFYGKGGISTWQRNNINPDSCYVTLSNYKINLSSFRFNCDTVEFINKKLFGNKILNGSFADRLYSQPSEESSTYPQFETSNGEMFLFKNVFDGIDIFGPFVQHGKRTVFGEEKNVAILYIHKNTTTANTATASKTATAGVFRSNKFILKDNKISAPLASFAIYLKEDSLYHNAAEIQYDNDNQTIRISNSSMISGHFPFTTTYHSFQVDADQVIWDIKKCEIELGILHIPGTSAITSFNSLDSYDERESQEVSGSSEKNPLYILQQLVQKTQDNEIMIYDISRAFAFEPSTTKSMLIAFASMGFLNYNIERETVTILPKLSLYLSVAAGKKDFDVIRILSQTSNQVYGIINTDSLTLQLFGIKNVLLSKKQNVFFIPQNETVTIKKNREIFFDGIVHGGRFDFLVKGAVFNYDKFKIDIANIDTLAFTVKEFVDNPWDSNLNRKDVPVNTIIHSLSGTIFIDDPANKGGLKDVPDYPMFKSTKPSYVYYDHSYIQDGVYLADSFYFRIDTFLIKNLNKFETSELAFKGTLVSYNIFPDFRESLRVMRDYSLGLTTVAPKGGWTLYSRGLFYDTVQLDNSGLTGRGKINYLYSNTRATSITFRPHVMWAKVNSFSMMKDDFTATTSSASGYANSDITFPEITGKKLTQEWLPYEDYYKVSCKRDNPMIFFDEKENWTLKGDYIFGETNSYGSGILSHDGEENFASHEFIFNNTSFTSDSVAFRIRSRKTNTILFDIADVSVNVLLDDRTASFVANQNSVEAAFTENQYRANTTDFIWDMKTHCLSMNIERFTSSQKNQGQLSFIGENATFCYRDTVISIEGVQTIQIADARIEPHEQRVKIFAGAKIETLKNARLYFGAEDDTSYYFYNATVDIFSSTKYQASAYYDYHMPNIKVQSIFFSDVKPNSEGKTVSAADVSIDEPLLLNEAFSYSGKLSFSSDNPFMYFNGYAKMLYGCDGESEADKSEIRFASYINPHSVSIPISPLTRNRKNRPLKGGFYSDAKSGEPKYVFLEPIGSSDQPIIAVKDGFLKFDSERKSYVLSDSIDRDLLVWELDKCIASAVGKMELNLLTDKLNIDFFGRLTQYQNTGENELQTTATFDFFLDPALLKKIALMVNIGMRTQAANTASQPHFMQYLAHTLSSREYNSVNKELSSFGAYTKVPQKLNHTMLLSDLWMKWSDNLNAYVSKGNVEIVSLGDNIVNKSVKMTVSITRSRRGDAVDFYIEPDIGNWVYGNITDNMLQIVSSDDEFNEAVEAIKENKRKKKGFEYGPSTLRKKNAFMIAIGQMEETAEEEEFEEEVPAEEEMTEEPQEELPAEEEVQEEAQEELPTEEEVPASEDDEEESISEEESVYEEEEDTSTENSESEEEEEE
jgi:hypothetical protein